MTRGPVLLIFLLFLAAAAALALVLLNHSGQAPETPPVDPASVNPASTQRVEAPPLPLPDWWNRDDPLPVVRTNCMRCHLTAGRELTRPVRDFARSAHDRAGYSCNDCHGGNTEDDATAHEGEHGFIGTKLSAHMAACAECHVYEAGVFRRGKHYQDLTKGIKTTHPTCIDCHGNHDIGNPPEGFTLTNVCTDCHKDFAAQMPHAAAVVAENDRLAAALRRLRTKSKAAADPVPAALQHELAGAGKTTAKLLHGTEPITPEQAEELNHRVRHLRERLEAALGGPK